MEAAPPHIDLYHQAHTWIKYGPLRPLGSLSVRIIYAIYCSVYHHHSPFVETLTTRSHSQILASTCIHNWVCIYIFICDIIDQTMFVAVLMAVTFFLVMGDHRPLFTDPESTILFMWFFSSVFVLPPVPRCRTFQCCFMTGSDDVGSWFLFSP